MRAVPEAVEESEIYEDWRDEDDGPRDGDGGVPGVKCVREWDDHCGVWSILGGSWPLMDLIY